MCKYCCNIPTDDECWGPKKKSCIQNLCVKKDAKINGNLFVNGDIIPCAKEQPLCQILQDIKDKLCMLVDKPLIDPVTGCIVSSQAVLNLRNVYSETVFKVCPQYGFFSLLASGTPIFPPSGNIEEFAKWQAWTEISVTEQVSLLNSTRDKLINSTIPNMYEQERQELLSLGFDISFYLMNPRRMANSTVWSLSNSTRNDSMGGFFYVFNSQFGANLFALVFGLDLTIQSWRNYVRSLEEHIDYLARSAKNNIVWSELALGIARQLYFDSVETGKAIEDTIAYAPFRNGTPEQQAEGKIAFQLVRDATDKMNQFLQAGSEYSTKAIELRSPSSPGLGAPGLNPDVKNIQYPYILSVVANTGIPPAEIHQLGLQQVVEISNELYIVVRDYVDPTVTSFADLSIRYRTEPKFRSQFLTEQTVQQRKNTTEFIMFDAYSNLTKAFQNFPRSPLQVDMFPGFSAQNYMAPIIQPDGTGTVTLANGIYSQNTLSNTDPINYDEVVTVDKSFDSSTAYHEAFPGHHLQEAIKTELPCTLVSFFNSGAAEGWALYAEQVAANDMELALVPENVFRRIDYLNSRLFRAVRLVLDTGLHFYGWSRQQSVDYFIANSLNDIPFIESEVDRYITFPGQAVGYLIGALVLDRERKRATDALVSQFDLRQWHDVLIRFLAPIEVLISQLTDFYIRDKLDGTFGQLWPPITRQPDRPVLGSIVLPGFRQEGLRGASSQLDKSFVSSTESMMERVCLARQKMCKKKDPIRFKFI